MTCDTTRHSCQPGGTGGNGSHVQQGRRLRDRLLLPSDHASVRAELAVPDRRRLRRRHGLRCAPHLRARPDELHDHHRLRGRLLLQQRHVHRDRRLQDGRGLHAPRRRTTPARTTPACPAAAAATCKLDKDCAGGPDLRQRHLPPNPTNPTGCTTNAECGQGGLCVNGQCENGCSDASTCGTGQVCSGGHCVTDPERRRRSAPRTPTARGNAPASTAPATRSCSHEQRLPNATDVCVGGVCVANTGRTPQCHNNAECGAGLECVNALCRAHCFNSNADCAQCAGTNICAMGYCQ